MKMQHNWMRRLLALASLLLVCIVLFASCNSGDSQPTEPSTPTEAAPTETSKPTEPHVHAWSEWSVTTAPTCTEKGEESRSCSCGEKETKSIDATGHTEVIDAAVDPACNATGLTEGKHCSVCNETIVAQEVVAKLEHTPATDAAVAPTCMETGLTEGTHCSVCNEVITKQEIVKANGHTWGVWSQTKAPNCTEKGEERRDCNVCDHYETREVNANGHTNKDAVVENKINETCTADGSYDSVIYCSVCNGEVSREAKILPKLGHDHSTEWTVDIEPTCTEKGSKSHHCSRCSDKADVTEISANGHTWGVWSQTKAPNCTEKGEERRDCDVCDHYETREVNANGHTNKDAVVENKINETCTADGSYDSVIYCSVCNGEVSREAKILPKLGHDHSTEWTVDIEPTCTEKGSKSHHCSRCSDKADVTEISANGHTWGAWTQTKAPDCTKKGEDRRDCDICDHYETKEINANGHTESDFVVDIAPTIYSEGSQHTYCTVCNEHMQINVVIPRIVSNGLAYEVNANGTTCTITGIGTCTDTEIGIPDTIDGYKVTAIGDKAFENCTHLTKILLQDSITTIGKRAFYKCSGITEIAIPVSVTNIGTQVFYGCGNLKTVYYNSTYSSQDNTFLAVNNIETVIFGGSYVPAYIAYNCATLKNVIILDNVKKINPYAFYGCTELSTVSIGKSITSIGSYAFFACDGITSVYISDLVTWCNISFYDDNSNPVRRCSDIYLNNEIVTEITIPNSISKINKNIFLNWNKITKVTIPDTITSIGSSAFRGCGSLTNISIPDSVMSIGSSAFQGCSSLTSIAIPDSVTIIGMYAFAQCTSLSSIAIPDSISKIDENVFSNCESLTSIIIPNSVTSIGRNAFSNCTSLTRVTLSNSLTSIGGDAFSGCRNLLSIILPNSVKSIGSYAFYNCYKLVEVYNLSPSITIIPGSFDNGYIGCYPLDIYTSADAQSKLWTDNNGYVFYIDGDNCYLMGYTGYATELTLPENCNGKIYEIYKYAFYGRDSLTNIIIPDGITTIGDSAFRGCNCLTSITIPSSIQTINEYAFAGCDALSNIKLSKNITNIGRYSFLGCDMLTTIVYEGTVTQWNSIVEGELWHDHNYSVHPTDVCDYTIYCIDGNITKDGIVKNS